MYMRESNRLHGLAMMYLGMRNMPLYFLYEGQAQKARMQEEAQERAKQQYR